MVLKPGTGKKKPVHKGESETLSNGDYLWIIPEVDTLLYFIEIEIPTGESSANLLASKSDESLSTTVPEKSGGKVDKKRNFDEQAKTDLNAKPKPSTQVTLTQPAYFQILFFVNIYPIPPSGPRNEKTEGGCTCYNNNNHNYNNRNINNFVKDKKAAMQVWYLLLPKEPIALEEILARRRRG